MQAFIQSIKQSGIQTVNHAFSSSAFQAVNQTMGHSGSQSGIQSFRQSFCHLIIFHSSFCSGTFDPAKKAPCGLLQVEFFALLHQFWKL